MKSRYKTKKLIVEGEQDKRVIPRTDGSKWRGLG